MITVHAFRDGKIVEYAYEIGQLVPPDAVWIDVLKPGEGGREALVQALGIDLPTQAEMQEIEASSRLYTEDGTSYMTSPVVAKADSPEPQAGVLTFVLAPSVLVTLRDVEPTSLTVFAARLKRQPGLAATPAATMVGLLETMVDRSADVLELVGSRLETLSRQIFEADKPSSRHAGGMLEVLRGVGRAGDLLGKMRDSLAGMERIAAYLGTADAGVTKDQRSRLKTVLRDLRSLAQHAEFQGQRTSFLLDATLGVISVEQNNIVKIFSVAASCFLPPTLIASMYGMNFEFMPELHWEVGYPLALLLIVLSAVLPLWWFRKKGWM